MRSAEYPTRQYSGTLREMVRTAHMPVETSVNTYADMTRNDRRVMRRLNPGQDHEGAPIIGLVPPYKFKSTVITRWFLDEQFNDCALFGIDAYHSKAATRKVGANIANVQLNYAMNARSIEELVKLGHASNREVYILGASLGGNALSAMLNLMAERDPEERVLPDKAVAMVSGNRPFGFASFPQDDGSFRKYRPVQSE